MSAAARALLVAAALAVGACASSPRAARQPDPGSEPAVPAPRSRALPHPPVDDASRVEHRIHVALGVPKDADPSDDHYLDKDEFVVSYNARLNAANWVAWNLDRKHLGRAPRSRGFRSDLSLPATFYVVRDADYAGSGFDRGHLCPSADRTASPEQNLATFVLSNVHPQLHELNAGPWAKLEEHERELARRGKELYVVAGGLFDREPRRIGKEADPSRVTAETETLAVVMPNEADAKERAWTDYAVSVRDVEIASGYDFHGRVPRRVQDAIERRRGAAATAP
jgi:endonuclease G